MREEYLPAKVNATLLDSVLNRFQIYFEPYFKELVDNSHHELPYPPESLVTSEGNQWRSEDFDLINSDGAELLIGKQINCRVMRPYAEIYMLRQIQGLHPQSPESLTVRLWSTYSEFCKEKKDPQFYQIWNTSNANFGGKTYFEDICYICFCMQVIAVAGK